MNLATQGLGLRGLARPTTTITTTTTTMTSTATATATHRVSQHNEDGAGTGTRHVSASVTSRVGAFYELGQEGDGRPEVDGICRNA
jgi:hypothetical protein